MSIQNQQNVDPIAQAVAAAAEVAAAVDDGAAVIEERNAEAVAAAPERAAADDEAAVRYKDEIYDDEEREDDEEIEYEDEDEDEEETSVRSIPVELFAAGSESNTSHFTKAYFLASNNIKFRHEGKIDESPPLLYLEDVTSEKRALVYYSSSGSGKTSELVGSSATRDCHLAFILTIVDHSAVNYSSMEAVGAYATQGTAPDVAAHISETLRDSQDPSLGTTHTKNTETMARRVANQLAAESKIIDKLMKLVSSATTSLVPILQAVIHSPQQLRVVLAIDEGSSCPRVVRGILRGQVHMGVVVADAINRALQEKGVEMERDLSAEDLAVKVSIAGTGVASSAVGSLPATFRVLQPFHDRESNKIINRQLQAANITVSVPWSSSPRTHISTRAVITENFPVIATMMQNGRLASIAIALLKEYAKHGEEIKEPVLVNEIVERFMKANGLESLLDFPRKKRAVAASALAAHLFRKLDTFKVKVPQQTEDIAEWASKMKFWSFSTGVTVKQLVTKYGLLEPPETTLKDLEENRGETIEPPLEMTLPQQLIAVFMLGLSMESMLEPSWFGFELMSTHFVKCAIAASAALSKDVRLSVKDTLSLLGFQVDPNATSPDVLGTWQELGNWCPLSTVPPSPLQSTEYHSRTRQLCVGLAIVEDSDRELLQIEEKLYSTLTESTFDDEELFGPPIACINEGNSDLCDGIVSFWAFRVGNYAIKKMISIENQAKDYHGTSGISTTKLNAHAQTMKSKLLDGVFGDLRLLCVASTHRSLVTQRRALDREYLPFVFNQGKLLQNLLGKLKCQRSEASKIEKYAVYCDSNGSRVVAISRKRKSSNLDTSGGSLDPNGLFGSMSMMNNSIANMNNGHFGLLYPPSASPPCNPPVGSSLLSLAAFGGPNQHLQSLIAAAQNHQPEDQAGFGTGAGALLGLAAQSGNLHHHVVAQQQPHQAPQLSNTVGVPSDQQLLQLMLQQQQQLSQQQQLPQQQAVLQQMLQQQQHHRNQQQPLQQQALLQQMLQQQQQQQLQQQQHMVLQQHEHLPQQQLQLMQQQQQLQQQQQMVQQLPS